MRASRRLGLTLLVGFPLVGLLGWRVVGALAAPSDVGRAATSR